MSDDTRDIKTKIADKMRDIGYGEDDIQAMLEHLKRYDPKLSLKERKATILARVQDFLATVIKPQVVRPEAVNEKYHYPVDVTVEWCKRTLYFSNHLYDPTTEEVFTLDYARMSLQGGDTFNLAYKRHTGKYFMLYERMSLEDSFHYLEHDMLLRP